VSSTDLTLVRSADSARHRCRVTGLDQYVDNFY